MDLIISSVTGHMQARGWFMWQRQDDGRYRVSPVGDFASIWSDAVCVVDDFGNLVRVPS